MFKVLIDTCVWLEIAQDAKYGAQIASLRELIKQKKLTLIVPRTVLSEFQKNKQRIAQRAERGLSSHFSIVKDAIKKFEVETEHREKVLKHLSDLDHKIPLLAGATSAALDEIELVMKQGKIVELSEAIKLRSAERALNRQAPCHTSKNSMADAVIIETYFEETAKGKAGDRFAFVTHNKNDFSDMKVNEKNPHPTLETGFSKVKSLYFIQLADCLTRIDPELLKMIKFEVEYAFEVRSLSDIMDALDTLDTQVWYNRHKNLEWSIKHGEHRVVTKAEWEAHYETTGKYPNDWTIDSVWKMAKEAGKRAEKKLGKGNHGPWDDFEWGMLNGKLSALRWALGEDWDSLDT